MYQNEKKTLIILVCDVDERSKYSGSRSQMESFQECNMSEHYIILRQSWRIDVPVALLR
jgi:hypothetical protein